MDGTFTLTVTLGNEAMCTTEDVADLLVNAATRIRNAGYAAIEGKLRDANGNTVGSWSFDEGAE
jgi:hypothetical protein